MRIIAGSKRGMKLLPPKGLDTRPITDRVKESVFSIMYKWDLPEDAVTADLFCGTGSFGLEALSRGAKWVTFVDKGWEVVQRLERNIAKADFTGQTRVIRHNVLSIGAPADEELYDLVFIDPPYDMSENCDLGTKMYGLMKRVNLQVKEGAIVILRTYLRSVALDLYGELEQIDKREWGNMKVMFYRKTARDNLLGGLESGGDQRETGRENDEDTAD